VREISSEFISTFREGTSTFLSVLFEEWGTIFQRLLERFERSTKTLKFISAIRKRGDYCSRSLKRVYK